MKITKINDNSIRCVISREEMSEKGINLDELMDDRSKAEEFLRYVLQQARYEVNFVTKGEALNVQMTVMKDGDVSLMISDDQNMAIHAMLAQFKEKLREFQETLANGGKNNTTDVVSLDPAQTVLLTGASDDEIVDMDVWVELDTLDDCMLLANSLSLPDAESRLLKYHDSYYLTIHLEQSRKELARSVFSIAEYSENMYTVGTASYYIEEHGKVLIGERALYELSVLAGQQIPMVEGLDYSDAESVDDAQ